MEIQFETIVNHIHEKDSRYKEEAYGFVMESLSYTQKKFRSPRHVTGEEILDGMKEMVLEKFGPLAMTVLEHWGIHSTEDFGNIVFNLVEHKVLSKTEEDNIEKFRNAYDFEEVFKSGYNKRLAKKISRMRTM